MDLSRARGPAAGRSRLVTLTAAYRALLERLDAWMAGARRRHPGVIPCGAGCSACCHGPFDVTVADALLLREALDRLAEAERDEVAGRARRLLDRIVALEPGWLSPYEIAAIGDERFDAIADALAGEPCPLLGDDGRCRVYEHRPMVCRMMGLPLGSPAGRVIENACPIQERFPAYSALAPEAFDLEDFERVEAECLRDAAGRLLGDPSRWEFETTIAAVTADEARR